MGKHSEGFFRWSQTWHTQQQLLGNGKALLVCVSLFTGVPSGIRCLLLYCKMSPSTCAHHLKFFIEPSYCCLRADGSWRPAPGKRALASIGVSIQTFQPGRRWEQAQLLNLSRANLETMHTPGGAPNTPVGVLHSLLQGNVWPHSLSTAALHKTEKGGCLKARNGTGVREFAAQLDWSCSYLCLWYVREHMILLELPNICQFCATEEFLFPGQNS